MRPRVGVVGLAEAAAVLEMTAGRPASRDTSWEYLVETNIVFVIISS